MKLRIAKKIAKNAQNTDANNKLKHYKHQIVKAENILKRYANNQKKKAS